MLRRRRLEVHDAVPLHRLLWTSTIGDVTGSSVPGDDAFTMWEGLRSSGAGWPLILGDDTDVARVIEQATHGSSSVEDTLAIAATLTYRDLVQRWKAENDSLPDDEVSSDVIGEWPAQASPHKRLAITHGLDGRPLGEVTVATLPTRDGWQTKPGGLELGRLERLPKP